MMFMGGFVVAVMIAACVVSVLKIDLTPKAAPGKPVERTRNFGEGLKLGRHGLYGLDLVSIGKARMRKLRKGPFMIGAINELVLEDVALVLPEELWRGERSGVEGQEKADGRDSQTGPRVMLSKLGVDAGNLKLGAKMPRFSALSVSNISVARLEGANAAPWFAAAGGKAERSGLALENGWSVEGGKTNRWQKAYLVVEPRL